MCKDSNDKVAREPYLSTLLPAVASHRCAVRLAAARHVAPAAETAFASPAEALAEVAIYHQVAASHLG